MLTSHNPAAYGSKVGQLPCGNRVPTTSFRTAIRKENATRLSPMACKAASKSSGQSDVTLKFFGVLAAVHLVALPVAAPIFAVPDAGDLLNTLEEQVLPELEEKLAAVADRDEATAVEKQIEAVEEEITNAVESESKEGLSSFVSSAAEGIAAQVEAIKETLGLE